MLATSAKNLDGIWQTIELLRFIMYQLFDAEWRKYASVN